MVKVLYIDCCIRREESRTRLLAETFLSGLQSQKGYSVEKLCLMDENLAPLSEGFFTQREVLLLDDQRDHPRFRYAHQFRQADRLVVAAPFWDLSFPALLKLYIENICVEGITFGANEQGTFGLCKAERLLFLTTRGGNYNNSPLEMGARYLEALCEFWGIPRFDVVAADGLDLGKEPVQTILDRAMEEVLSLVDNF
ncbi:MAG: NAD(P)H-dependent oxidoreductase [Anaerolineaceae bacterium]